MKKLLKRITNNENGQMMVMVAVALVALLGFGAFAIDIGSVAITKSELQNAADAGALAGAKSLPDANSVTIAEDYATTNGAVDPVATKISDTRIQVVCQETVQYTFARVLGFNSKTVTATATAEKSSGGLGPAFGYAIFSGNRYPTAPSYSVKSTNQFVITGSTNTVNGNIHGNYNIVAGTVTINGTASAVGTVAIKAGTKKTGAAFIPIPDLSYALPAIKAAAIAANQYYSGSFSKANAASVNLSAPLYVEKDANLSGISFSGKGCIYAGGKITITGSDTNYTSDSSIAMYSGFVSTTKSPAGIDFSGSSKNFKGILYAPNSSILVSGSNYTFNGSLIGRVVDISGSNKTFKAADASDSFPYGTAVSVKLVN